jgi:hypothetical protein
MPPAFGFDKLIKGIEDNVGEQRGGYSPNAKDNWFEFSRKVGIARRK